MKFELKRTDWRRIATIAARLGLVLGIALTVIAMLIGLLGIAIPVTLVLAVAGYAIVLAFAALVMILVGSAVPTKDTSVLRRRNWTVSVALALIFISVLDQLGVETSFFSSEITLGALGIIFQFSFLHYMTLLAFSGMSFHDRLEGETDNDLYARRALYVPVAIMKDFLFPAFLLMFVLLLTYSESTCLLLVSMDLFLHEVFLFGDKLSELLPEIKNTKDNFESKVSSMLDFFFLDKVTVQNRFGGWFGLFHPSCHELELIRDGRIHLL